MMKSSLPLRLVGMTTVVCMIVQATLSVAAAGNLTVTGVRCEYIANPIGIDAARPRFTWQLDSTQRGQRQTAYQILVASSRSRLSANKGDVWDSGKVRSDLSVNIPYNGVPLQSGGLYYYKIRSWNGSDRPSRYSRIGSFEMGLLQSSDWSGKWIGADQAISAPLVRKTILLPDKPITRARAYICGLGYYELHINGRKVGDRVLDPAWTDYDKRQLRKLNYPFDDQTTKRVLYATYDVTSFLKANAANAIAVMLGNGMYNNHAFVQEGDMWYGSPRMIIQLNIEYADGTQSRIASDHSWKTADGPITRNYIHSGETYDARLEKEGWDTSRYDDSAWKSAHVLPAPAGKLYSETSPPDKITRKIIPISVSPAKGGGYVFDVGENITGWVKLKNLNGPRGGIVAIDFGEEVGSNGAIGSAKTGCNMGEDVYILKGAGAETYEPRFSYQGFRYFTVRYADNHVPTVNDVEVDVVHSAVESVGSFRCSSDLLNWFHDAYRRTQLNNMHSGVPTDCPTRERLGYTGDGQLTCESVMLNFDMAQFYRKWMDDISDAQNKTPSSKSFGFVPHTAPFYGGGGGPPWGSACIIVPWNMYLYYADERILREHYDGMQYWMRYLGTKTDGRHIIISEEPGGWKLGEWCMPGINFGGISDTVVNTYYYARDAKLMSQIASVLGKSNDVTRYQELYDSIAASFNKTFLGETKPGQYANGGMGADAYPLALGIVPDEKRSLVVSNLIYSLFDSARMNGHFDTGIIGTPVTLEALLDCGRGDLAYALLTQTTYPSFGYWRSLGATTLWEAWEPAGGSHDHAMFGSVDAFIFRNIGGINADPQFPGFQKIIIKPGIRTHLAYAKSSIRSVRGLVEANWNENKNGDFIMDVTVPCNACADIYFPENSARASLNITETGSGAAHEIWGLASYAPGTPGITGARETTDATGKYIVISSGSGHYRFVSGQTAVP